MITNRIGLQSVLLPLPIDRNTALLTSVCLFQHLERQQVGLMHLIGIIKEDLQDLATIERGLTELPSSRR